MSNIVRPKDRTVYHLRKRALTEQVTERELYLCLNNILQARGHFLMENIDFTRDTIKFEDYKKLFYDTFEPYINIPDRYRAMFETVLLQFIFTKSLKANDIRNTISKTKKFFFMTKEEKERLKEICLLISGYSSNVTKISSDLDGFGNKVTIAKLKDSEDDIGELFESCIVLFDCSTIASILKNHQYICEGCVEKLDKFSYIYHKYGKNSQEFKDAQNELLGKVNTKPAAKKEETPDLYKTVEDPKTSKKGRKPKIKEPHIRVIKNLENSFPNGMYIKEARAILKKQQEFNPKITDEFIEVCESIISARIPYYIGPLNERGTNAWVSKNGKIKYSYDYSMKHNTPVNEAESIRSWKERMISRCTYLPEFYALPKGSFIGETFSIVNGINVLTASDGVGEAYHLTRNDKIKLFDSLFLNKKNVSYSEIAETLGLSSFGTRKSKEGSCNNGYTLYHSIVNEMPELKLDSITEIFTNPDKITKIEDIILAVNLYDEQKTRIEYFVNSMNIPEETAAKISKLKSKSFYSFSKEFIMQQPMDPEGHTLMELLFEDNSSKFTNEQMTRITNAMDKDGVYYDFTANKYEKKIIENGGNLDVNLLFENNKPVIPISRPVIRALNEAMKVYTAHIDAYGVPDRVVIETARDMKDHTEEKQQTVKKYSKLEDLSKYLTDKMKKEDDKDHALYVKYLNPEEWKDIKGYAENPKNRTKIELYLRQGGIDLLTGQPIMLNRLEEYEIDHILPRGFGDDSMDDKVLISKISNGKKGQRLPLEFIAEDGQIGDIHVSYNDYVARVNLLYKLKLISDRKKKIMLLDSSEKIDGFINQDLVDTRYIIREFMAILRAYNKVHGYQTHVVALKGAYTSMYRKAFGMQKERNFGDQHHAQDAALLLVADKTLSTYYPHYDERKMPAGSKNSYHELIQKMQSHDPEVKKSLYKFFRTAFYYAYGKEYKDSTSIVEKIKNTVPFYSTKVDKSYNGAFFNVSILKQKEKKDDPEEKTAVSPLTVLGVNNEKRIFDSVQCVAVDFYKVPIAGKKEKKTIIVHIPKLIVDRNGNIDQDKYITLVRDYYKYDILLDENGNLRTEFFRFRAYRNDIIYNTATNCPMTFNIGSIANKRCLFKHINVFSHNDIYNAGRRIAEELIRKYNLKTKNNPDGVDFKDIKKEVFVNDVVKNYFTMPTDSKKIETMIKKVENDKNVYDLSNHLSFFDLTVNRSATPPSIDGSMVLSADSDLLCVPHEILETRTSSEIKSVKSNSEYVKLKYNILGVRFISLPRCKLEIQTPKPIQGAYSKIRKEEFSWKIDL